jgi:hypothetical protein
MTIVLAKYGEPWLIIETFLFSPSLITICVHYFIFIEDENEEVRLHVSGGGGGRSRGRRCPRRCGRWSRGMEGEDRRPRGPADEVAAEAGETARRRREETATAAVAAEKGAAA